MRADDWAGVMLGAAFDRLFSPFAARLLLGLLVLGLTAAAYFRPEYNWDMLAYIGSAAEGRFTDIKALHAYVFDSVRQAIRPEGWQKLIQGTAWREGAFASPQMFGSVLELYRVKLLFVASVATLGKLVGVAHAPYVLGWAFGVLSLLLSFAMLRRLGLERFFALAVPVIPGANLQWTTRLPTPDSMAGFFVLAGVYAYAFSSRTLAYGLLSLAVLTRPDSLVLVAALVLVQAARRDLWRTELIAVARPVLCYLLATRLAGNGGWWPHF